MGTLIEDAAVLAKRVRGPVLLPGVVGFDEEISPWNTAVVHRPDIAVGVADAEDVAATLRWAAQRRLRVAIQATGHGPSAGVDGGVLITTRRLAGVSVDPHARTAWIGAGVKWGRVIEAAAAHGLAPLNGSTSDVGALGYSLGGGLGLMARKYGFAADHVRTVRIVTSDGLMRTVDADHEPDLFWAVRGAGKGRFGVVTEIEVDLVPVSRLYGGAIYYPASAAAAVMHAFGPWTQRLPEETTTSIAMLRLPDLPHVPAPIRGQFVVHLRVSHLGSTEDGERLLAPMRAVAPALIDAVREMPYTAVDAIHSDPVNPGPAYEAGVLLRTLPAEAVDALLAVAGPGVQIPLAMVELRQLGGATARPAPIPNAVSGREGAYSLLALGPMLPGVEHLVPAVVKSVLDAVEPFTAPTSLANFQGHAADPDEEFSAWPLADRERLVLAQKTYDPAGMFTAGR